MAENTATAKCTEGEWEAARAAGLLFADLGSTAQEIALHKFAGAMRAELVALLRDAASDIDCLLDFVGESNAIGMIGATTAYEAARNTLARIDEATAN